MGIRFKDNDFEIKCLKFEKGFKSQCFRVVDFSVKGLVERGEHLFRERVIREGVKKVEVEGRGRKIFLQQFRLRIVAHKKVRREYFSVEQF